MKINFEVDLNDLEMYGSSIDEEIVDHLKTEVMKIVKRDAKYKAWIQKKALSVLNGLEV